IVADACVAMKTRPETHERFNSLDNGGLSDLDHHFAIQLHCELDVNVPHGLEQCNLRKALTLDGLTPRDLDIGLIGLVELKRRCQPNEDGLACDLLENTRTGNAQPASTRVRH